MASEPILRRTGTVRSVAAGRAVIAFEAQGCSGCGKRSACGLGRLAGDGRTLLELPVAEVLAPGELVSLEIPEHRLPAAALKGYLLPAALVILGAGLGEAAGGDGAAALGALLGLLAGLAPPRLLHPRLAPVLVKRA